ncbi:MAG: sulfatase-like hydrolase/transferase [Anaerolineae bacterium]|nr:sulfatase-like hydrolase/transferase [Anaerolineae bacterium]
MPQPNLLFLMTDQQRSDTVAPDSPCLTPNIDALAAEGTRFNRCHAVNPICSPNRASLMTGLYPHSHGMVDVTHAVEPYRAGLKPDLPFWSRNLQAAGYRTGYFGKWHIERSNRLENFGFDTYDIERYHQKQGLVAADLPLKLRGTVRQKGYGDFLLYGVTDQPVEATPEYQLYSDGIHFIEQAGQTPDQPWALFLSTEAPHDPYVVPGDYFARYNPAEIPRPPSFGDDLADRPAIYRRLQSVWQELEWPSFAEATACYYGFCSLIDDQVGRIVAALRQSGQIDNTLIVFTSDHGDYMGAHRLLLKGIPAFDEAYSIPLILRGPGIAAGRHVDAHASLIDLAPTLVELTTGDNFVCQGRSLVPLIQADAAAPDDWRPEAFAECHGQRFHYTQRILWRDEWKYVFNGFDYDELYNLADDPYEQVNRAHDPACRQELEMMAERMWALMYQTNDYTMTQAQYGMFRFAPVGPEYGKD